MARIDAFLKLGTQQGCSDIHLAVGVPPMLRMHGDLVPIKFRDLRDTELEGYIHGDPDPEPDRALRARQRPGLLLRLRRRRPLPRQRLPQGHRHRRHLPRHPDGDADASTSSGCRRSCTKLCDYHQGMILVTGSTGTGKSTTLAAMIDLLNQTRALNIISLEDPIEFVHRSKSSQVIQRELGTHIPSFAEGVRAAMREDPDVILVGELRDAETISHGDDGRRDRPPRARHAAHDQRRQDHRPASSTRCPPRSASRPRASWRRACSPWSRRCWSRPPTARGRARDLRGHGDDQGDRAS